MSLILPRSLVHIANILKTLYGENVDINEIVCNHRIDVCMHNRGGGETKKGKRESLNKGR